MNVRLVYVSADYKGMIAFSKTLCKFYAQPVCFFRGNLTRAENKTGTSRLRFAMVIAPAPVFSGLQACGQAVPV